MCVVPGEANLTQYSRTIKDPFTVAGSSCLLAQINSSIHSYFHSNNTSANFVNQLTGLINFYDLLIPAENFHKYPSLRAPPEVPFYS